MFIYGANDDLYQKTARFQNRNYFFFIRCIRLSTIVYILQSCTNKERYRQMQVHSACYQGQVKSNTQINTVSMYTYVHCMITGTQTTNFFNMATIVKLQPPFPELTKSSRLYIIWHSYTHNVHTCVQVHQNFYNSDAPPNLYWEGVAWDELTTTSKFIGIAH